MTANWHRGSELPENTKATILRTFVHRLTRENGNRVGASIPETLFPSDAEWLDRYAFAVTRDLSRLDGRVSHCMPAFLVLS